MAEQSRSASAGRRKAEARMRAERAADRAIELRDLEARLEAGEPLTEVDLKQAQDAAHASAEDAQVARLHDREAHLRSAETHRHAAALLLERGRAAEASNHITAAEADEAAAGRAGRGE